MVQIFSKEFKDAIREKLGEAVDSIKSVATPETKAKIVSMYDKAKDAVMKGVDMAQSAIGKAGKEGGTIDEVLDKVEDSAYKFSDKMQEFGDKSSAKVSEAWDKLDDNGTVDDIREAFVKGTAKVMELWDKLEKSGKIDEVKETVEKVARKAADTAKGIAKEASERAAKAEEDFKADADQAADEEFKDEEI